MKWLHAISIFVLIAATSILGYLPEQSDFYIIACGGLSVPGLRGLVPRYRHIRYQGYDQNGKVIERSVSDFHARVVQHECDHLDGILYPQRISNMQYFGFCDALEDNNFFQHQPCDD